MKKIYHKYYIVFAGYNKIFMPNLIRSDTLIYIKKDTLIYNSTFNEDYTLSSQKVQYNFEVFQLQKDTNQFAFALKVTDKDYSINDLSPKMLIKDTPFNVNLKYKSIFNVKDNYIINKNLYSAEANNFDSIAWVDNWSKTFSHCNKIHYSMFKNFELKWD